MKIMTYRQSKASFLKRVEMRRQTLDFPSQTNNLRASAATQTIRRTGPMRKMRTMSGSLKMFHVMKIRRKRRKKRSILISRLPHNRKRTKILTLSSSKV